MCIRDREDGIFCLEDFAQPMQCEIQRIAGGICFQLRPQQIHQAYRLDPAAMSDQQLQEIQRFSLRLAGELINVELLQLSLSDTAAMVKLHPRFTERVTNLDVSPRRTLRCAVRRRRPAHPPRIPHHAWPDSDRHRRQLSRTCLLYTSRCV